MSTFKRNRSQRNYQRLKKQTQSITDTKKALYLSNKGSNQISKGMVYKAIFSLPSDVTINIPGTSRTYTIKEYSLHFLDPDSAINPHAHKNDSEIYFAPDLENHSWTSERLCSNGEVHSAQRPKQLNNKDNSIYGIRAGVKLKEIVTDENDKNYINEYLIKHVLPVIQYNSDLNLYGFKSKSDPPEICLAEVTDNGNFDSFAITSHSSTMHIVEPVLKRVYKNTYFRGVVTEHNILNSYNTFFKKADNAPER